MHNFLKEIKLLIAGNELKEIYANSIIRTIAFGLVGIFIPIYFLKLGHSLNSVLIYLIIYFLSLLFFSSFVPYVESKIGLKKTITLGCIFVGLFLLSVVFLAKYESTLPFLALFFGFAQAFYWVPLNADFSLQIKEGSAGKSFGTWGFLVSLAGLLTPTVGGLLLSFFEFDILLIIGAILIWASVIPFLLSPDYQVLPRKKFLDIIFSKEKELFFEFFSEGMILGVFVIWPIYIYYINPGYLFIGIMSTIAGVATAFFKYFYGILSDKFSKIFLLKFGTMFMIFILIFAYLFKDIYSISIISFVLGFFFTMHNTPLETFFSEYSKEDPIKWMTLREFGLCLGRIVSLLILFFTYSFEYIFLSAAVFSLFFLLVKPIK